MPEIMNHPDSTYKYSYWNADHVLASMIKVLETLEAREKKIEELQKKIDLEDMDKSS